jgi:DNA-binding winged helix-turn-helix (wHTH) protein/tetratricopeptide (TPR) repeat protein
MPDSDDSARPSPAEVLAFGDFRMDVAAEQLLRGDEVVFLRPKTWSVLRFLVESAGRIVTNRELLDAVWPGTAVTPSVLTNVVGELRTALDESGQAQRYVQTVHRRGYRFVAEVRHEIARRGADARPAFATGDAIFVGRAAELEILHAAWGAAARGERRIAFVAGEPGIGKSSLVDAFVARLLDGEAEPDRTPLVVRSQCIEGHGATAPYLPLLDAFEQIAAGAGRSLLLATLRKCAPAWLVHMPWLASDAELQALQKSLPGSGEARMVREGSRLLEALTSSRPLVLVLEDLHWSDPATLSVLTALAGRPVPARLLVLGTYRPVDALIAGHAIVSLARTLRQHDQATELALAPLGTRELHTYLVRRFASVEIASRLAPALEEQSGGNPLFVVALIAHLIARRCVRERASGWEMAEALDVATIGLPDDLRAATFALWAKLPPETREILEAASVDGVEFSVDTVAAGLGCDGDRVDDACHHLAERGQLVRVAEQPSRRATARSARYRFPHALHRRVLYDRLAPSRRREIHRRIGLHLETSGGGTGDGATRLLTHFEAAGDVERTIRYLELAGWNAATRQAYDAAAQCFASAIAHLQRLPADDTTRAHEAMLQLFVGNCLVVTRGWTDLDAVDAFAHAEGLARSAGAHSARFRALIGLSTAEFGAGNPRGAAPYVATMAAIAAGDAPELAAQAYWRSGQLCFEKGELADARALFERALQTEPQPGIPANIDLRVDLESLLGLTLAHLGLFDQARACTERALRRADQVELPFTYAYARAIAIHQCVLRRDPSGTLTLVEQVVEWVERYAFPSARLMEDFYRAWALHRQDPSRELARAMHDALRAKNVLGERSRDTMYLAEVADAYRQCGELGRAAECLEAAFAHVARTDERSHEAELYRVQGELRLAAKRSSRTRAEAEAAFERAIEVARRQGAKLWELRATVSLARSAAGGPTTNRIVRERLERICSEIEGGHDDFDLADAHVALAELR